MNKVDRFHNYGLLFWFVLAGLMFTRYVAVTSNDQWADAFGMGLVFSFLLILFLIVCWLFSLALYKIFRKTNIIQISEDSIVSFLGIFVILIIVPLTLLGWFGILGDLIEFYL